MNRLVLLTLVVFCLLSCKSKKEEKPEVPASNFFPVPAYVRGELARLDTALYSFYKIETTNGQTDTLPIKNSEVRRFAQDFLSLPDLSASEIKDDYEVTQLYDDLQEAFVFTFTTKEAHPVTQEDVTVEPEQNAGGKNDIKSIYANVVQNEGKTAVQKRLLWEAGKRFSTTTITRPPDGTEQIRKIQVVWNDFVFDKKEK